MSGRRAGAGSSARQRARELVFRVAYQADLGDESVGEAWARQAEDTRLSEDQRELVTDVVRALTGERRHIDATIAAVAAHWPIERMSATDRSVLRCAIAELIARPGTPARVVLDEAIELAKRFGSDGSGTFVNGVLDRIARDLRPEEFA